MMGEVERCVDSRSGSNGSITLTPHPVSSPLPLRSLSPPSLPLSLSLTVTSIFFSPPSASLFSLVPSFTLSHCITRSLCGSFLPTLSLARGEEQHFPWPAWRASWRRMTFQRLFLKRGKQSSMEMWLHLHGLPSPSSRHQV